MGRADSGSSRTDPPSDAGVAHVLIKPDEGRPHPWRLLLYVTVAIVASLAAVLPGLRGDDEPDAIAVDAAVSRPVPVGLAEKDPLVPPALPLSDGSAPQEVAPLEGTTPPAIPADEPIGPSPQAEPNTPPPTTIAPPPVTGFTWPERPEAPPPRPVVAPESGVFLGAYHDPHGKNGQASLVQILESLPEFDEQIGRKLAIISVYQPWSTGWVLNDTLARVADTEGAIPMVSWRCGTSNPRIAAGEADELIFKFANQLRDYGRPVLLRWFWEMNLSSNEACLGSGTEAEQAAWYKAAFARIASIFDMAGATNVAFVWAPSTATVANPMEDFYPGDEYVDWIGADGYSRRQLGLKAFSTQFKAWYTSYAAKGKPMIVAETGATTDLVDFLRGIAEVVPRDFPQIKAIVYFDGIGGIDWRLSTNGDGNGIAAFAELGRNPYFAVMPVEP